MDYELRQALARTGIKIVVSPHIPPDTIVVHANMAECLRVWAENQAPEPIGKDR